MTLLILGLALFAMWHGVHTALSGMQPSCAGKGRQLCVAALAIGELAFGPTRAHLGYAASSIAAGIVMLGLAWCTREKKRHRAAAPTASHPTPAEPRQ